LKFYIISGEASGDLHGSNLMKEIKLLDNDAVFRCWGGDLMQKQIGGGMLVKHYRDLAFMGFWEVLLNIITIFKNIRFCKRDIAEYKPDALILIDYPGFNLRIAKYAKRVGVKVFYYISPQVWAWKQSRVKLIRRVVDKMFVILPFEKEFYKNFDYDVEFVGHPLLDAMEEQPIPGSSQEGIKEDFSARGGSAFGGDSFTIENNLSDKPIIAILPGSRKQEVIRMLPVMLSIKEHYGDYQFVIAGTTSIPMEFYNNIITNDVSPLTNIVYDQTYNLLRHSKAALVTSGTATLETALWAVPEVVCYKGSPFSYFIAKRLVKTKYISLVNLIMDKEVVTELIQNRFNSANLKSELDKILPDNDHRSQMIEDYAVLKQQLGGKGASRRTAELMLRLLRD